MRILRVAYALFAALLLYIVFIRHKPVQWEGGGSFSPWAGRVVTMIFAGICLYRAVVGDPRFDPNTWGTRKTEPFQRLFDDP
jgi:hypothetical protein